MAKGMSKWYCAISLHFFRFQNSLRNLMNKGWDTSVKFNHLLCAIQGLVLFSNCLTFLCNILFFCFFRWPINTKLVCYMQRMARVQKRRCITTVSNSLNSVETSEILFTGKKAGNCVERFVQYLNETWKTNDKEARCV